MARSAVLLFVAFFSVGVAAACGTSEELQSAPTTVPSLAHIPTGSSGYELEVLLVGESERQGLIPPVPVGTTRGVDVRIEAGETFVSVLLEVVVDRSMADGSSDELRIRALEFSASDPAMARALAEHVGTTVVAVRGPNRVVERYEGLDFDEALKAEGELDFVGSTGQAKQQAAFWVRQLLQAPVSFGGPIPRDQLGLGAIWDVTFQDPDGRTTRARNTLVRLDSDRYIIEASSIESAYTTSFVLEGQVTSPIPDRQEIEVGGVVITVIANS